MMLSVVPVLIIKGKLDKLFFHFWSVEENMERRNPLY